MEMLQVEHVSKSYGAHCALRNVSLSVQRRAIYGLLGPNGAGKTTLIRLINQILAPDTGRIFIGGQPLRRADIRRIGYLPEERGLYKKMKVGDQAIFLARLKGMRRADAVLELKRWFAKFEIEGWWNKKVEELSKGMAQKVQFIVTVLHRPELLIFDEPFSGFDPINADLLKREILGLRDEGATVLFSTHNMESVQSLCDSITLINRSENILSGTMAEVRAKYSSPAYIIGYRGDPSALAGGLPAGWGLTREWEDAQGRWGAIHTGEDRKVSLRGVLEVMPEGVEVIHASHETASMHDIFIAAVEAAQRNRPVEG